MEQTKPMSTTRLWQKQAARKSTLRWEGGMRWRRVVGSGMKEVWEREVSQLFNLSCSFLSVLEDGRKGGEKGEDTHQ